MTPRGVRNEIENLLGILIGSEIAILASPAVLLPLATGSERVTWAPGQGSGELFRTETCTIDCYSSWLGSGEYSAILLDGAILQITYDFRGRSLSGHRLAYIPCPFDVSPEELRLDPLSDVVELYRSGGPDLVRLRCPLRFDYDPDSASREHSASHFTLLWDHCRCPTIGPLSLGHFVRFVFRSFYPELWGMHSFLREWPQETLQRTISLDDEHLLHIAWRSDASDRATFRSRSRPSVSRS